MIVTHDVDFLRLEGVVKIILELPPETKQLTRLVKSSLTRSRAMRYSRPTEWLDALSPSKPSNG
jgi:hypothetical protein